MNFIHSMVWSHLKPLFKENMIYSVPWEYHLAGESCTGKWIALSGNDLDAESEWTPNHY